MKINVLNLSLILLLLFAITINSCKKDSTNSDYPTLSMTAPTSSTMPSSGQMIHIAGTATASGTDDAHLLHELSFTVKKQSDNSIYWQAVVSVHDLQTYTIDTMFAAPTVAANTDYVLYDSLVNHLEKYATDQVTFSVIP